MPRPPGGTKRGKGKQKGAPGAALSPVENPARRVPAYPKRCGVCQAGLDPLVHEAAGMLARQQIDVPLVTAAEIEELASRARHGVVIVPSSDGAGTNALLRTPPDVIESRFGPGSFEAHWSQAQARGVPVEVARPAGLMFDIDTPDDVAELLVRAPDCRAARFLQCPSTS